MDKVWMKPPPNVGGEPQEVEASPEILVPLMVKGWSQCPRPKGPPPPAPENEKFLKGG